MRTATSNLTSKSSRLRLKPRPKPYNTTLHPGLMLGYIRRPVGAGSWVRRQLVDAVAERYEQRTLGLADDLALADGFSVMSFEQARAKVLDRPLGRLTVRQAVDLYLAHQRAAKGERAAADARQKLMKHVVPVLGEIEVAALTKQRIEAWRAALVPAASNGDAVRQHRASSNRVMAALKAVLNHVASDEANAIESDAAWRRTHAYKGVTGTRLDHFDADQVGRLLKASRADDPHFADLLEVAWLTAARYGELVACDVRHFDRRDGTLQIPSGKTGTRAVTLTRDATATLVRIVGKRALDAPLLPKADGSRWGAGHQRRPMRAALKAAKLAASASVYTLRHSCISRQIEAGVPLTVIALNGGTSTRMIEQTYGKHLAHVRRELLERASPALRVRHGR